MTVGVKQVAFQKQVPHWAHHNPKAARQLKTFLTLNSTLHLGHSQNVHGYSTAALHRRGRRAARRAVWSELAGPVAGGLARGTVNNMFVTQNVKMNLRPPGPEGQRDKLYMLIKQEDMWRFM